MRYKILGIGDDGKCTETIEFVHECPCCKYPTLSERNSYEICPLCDRNDSWDPSGVSLEESQNNFQQHLVMYPLGFSELTDRSIKNKGTWESKRRSMALLEILMELGPEESDREQLIKRGVIVYEALDRWEHRPPPIAQDIIQSLELSVRDDYPFAGDEAVRPDKKESLVEVVTRQREARLNQERIQNTLRFKVLSFLLRMFGYHNDRKL